MERILGLDLGSRTCGIAMSDALGMLAHGVETYRFSENAYEKAEVNDSRGNLHIFLLRETILC